MFLMSEVPLQTWGGCWQLGRGANGRTVDFFLLFITFVYQYT